MKTNKIGIPIYDENYVHDMISYNNIIAIFDIYFYYDKGRYINTNKYGINLRIKYKTK
jgi:hypothetical protein